MAPASCWRVASGALNGFLGAGLIVTVPILTLLACTGEPGSQTASGQPERSAYVDRLGSDTVSVEVYTRTADGFSGQVVIRSPVTRLVSYEAALRPDGTIERMNVEWTTPPENPDAPPDVGFTIRLEGDSASLERRGGREPGSSRIAAPRGAIPNVGTVPVTYAILEQAVRQALASQSDTFSFQFISAANGRTTPNAVVRQAGDTVSIDFFGSPFLARVDATGKVLGRSGERTTLKVVGERVETLDLHLLAAEWAAHDARGEGLGVASPRAEVRAAIGGANLNIVYSRPAKRGRKIWGGLVPWNEVWRTGANAATAFSSDRDLEIGGMRVPAGDYTLFSIFSPEKAQLIINQQTGQWGTVYNEDQDLARTEMRAERLGEVVDRFTIAIEPGTAPGQGILQLTWDDQRFSVPFAVK